MNINSPRKRPSKMQMFHVKKLSSANNYFFAEKAQEWYKTNFCDNIN